MWPKMTSSYPMMSSIFFPKQGRKIQFFSQLFSLLFFPHILEFLDFSHIGMIYESEITKTMKGLLNSMAHRSNFSEKKLSSSTYVGKTEISNPLLGKKSQLKNFPHTSPSKNYQNFSKLSKFSPSTVNSIGMMSSKMVDSSSNSNRLTMKW